MSPLEKRSACVALLEFCVCVILCVCHSQGNPSRSAIHSHPTLEVRSILNPVACWDLISFPGNFWFQHRCRDQISPYRGRLDVLMAMVFLREVTVKVTLRCVVTVLWSKVVNSGTVGEKSSANYSHIRTSISCSRLWSKNSCQSWTHVL
jgi:hypothetical protein